MSLSELWRLIVPMVTPFSVYQISVTVFSLFSLVNALADGFTFRRVGNRRQGRGKREEERENSQFPISDTPTPDPQSLTPAPSLSILIPARNEAAVIARCVGSLLQQDYPGRLEIRVLDDRSTDQTGAIVAALSEIDSRVRLLSGGELLPGWKGKPNALRQLAAEATGDLLLLTDADCVFDPGALTAAVAHRERTGADVLSLMPYLECGSFWEHVIVPLQYFLVFATLPIRNVYASKNPAFAAANGAFILLPARLYAELGGHEPVKNEMAEDIKFAQHVKKSGRKLVYADGSYAYRVRMYDSLPGIWEGFSKNLFPAMGKSVPVFTIWSLFLLNTQVLPFVFLTLALLGNDRSLSGFYLPFCQVVIALGIRFALSLRFRQAIWATLTHPFGWCLVIAIGINSAYQSLSGKGHTWKGRTYQS